MIERILGEGILQNRFAKFGVLGLLLLFSIGLASCSSSSTPTTGMGSANVTMSDPPSNTEYSNVWVTVDGVEATTSTSDTGWVPLVSGLSSTSGSIKAVQLDLLNLPANGQCLLAQLGSTQSLPVGDYGQIRLMLVPNNATGVTLIAPSAGEATSNQCTSVGAWNCAMPTGGTLTALQLSSQAQTGLKIPPGQVLGGPISVVAGQSVDLNIDFNADRSIVNEAGQLRLDPVLVAYQVSQNLTGISGQVVEGTLAASGVTATSTAIADANVALEMSTGNPVDGSNSVDLIGNYLRPTDSNGNFDFCPLPTGPFDVVVSAGPTTANSTTTTYGATIVTGVPNGTQLTVPVLSQTATGSTTLAGNLKSSAATSATAVDADIYALQTGGSSLEFAVPLLDGSNPSIAQLSLTCSAGSCTAPYSLVVPPSNPLIGAFSAGSISWTVPVAAPFTFKVEGTCTGSSGTLSVFSSSQTVTAGTSTSVPDLTLGTCQ